MISLPSGHWVLHTTLGATSVRDAASVCIVQNPVERVLLLPGEDDTWIRSTLGPWLDVSGLRRLPVRYLTDVEQGDLRGMVPWRRGKKRRPRFVAPAPTCRLAAQGEAPSGDPMACRTLGAVLEPDLLLRARVRPAEQGPAVVETPNELVVPPSAWDGSELWVVDAAGAMHRPAEDGRVFGVPAGPAYVVRGRSTRRVEAFGSVMQETGRTEAEPVWGAQPLETVEVRDAEGRPLPYTRVRVRNPLLIEGEDDAWTDGDGRLELPSGPLGVRVRWPSELPSVPGKGWTTEPRLVLPPDGDPAPRCEGWFRRTSLQGAYEGGGQDVTVVGVRLLDPSGCWALVDTSAGLRAALARDGQGMALLGGPTLRPIND